MGLWPLQVTGSPHRRRDAMGHQTPVGLAAEQFLHRFCQQGGGATLRQAMAQGLLHAQQVPGTALQPSRETLPVIGVAARIEHQVTGVVGLVGCRHQQRGLRLLLQ